PCRHADSARGRAARLAGKPECELAFPIAALFVPCAFHRFRRSIRVNHSTLASYRGDVVAQLQRVVDVRQRLESHSRALHYPIAIIEQAAEGRLKKRVSL